MPTLLCASHGTVAWLAHAGPGSTWQAMVTVVALGLALVVALVATGRLELSAPGDLVLPLAGVAILSSLAPLGDVWLSDWVGWSFPVGVVALASLVVAAFTPLRLAVDRPLLYAAVVLAAIGGLVLHQPLTLAWHPPAEMLPAAGDTEVVILEPRDGDRLPAGVTTVAVRVVGGSVGPDRVPFEDLPFSASEQGALEVRLAGERFEVEPDQPCTESAPCPEVTFDVDLPAGDELRLGVEFLRGDGMPFSPAVTDQIELETR